MERRAVHHGRGGRARRDAVARHGLRRAGLPRHPHGPALGAGQVHAALADGTWLLPSAGNALSPRAAGVLHSTMHLTLAWHDEMGLMHCYAIV